MNIGRQWPRGLRRESAAARLLGLRVRIPPGACMSLVNVVCCLVEVSASGWSLVQRKPTEGGVCKCDSEASTVRKSCAGIGSKRHWLGGGDMGRWNERKV